MYRRIADREGHKPRYLAGRPQNKTATCHDSEPRPAGGQRPGLGNLNAPPRPHQSSRPAGPKKPEKLCGPIPPKVRNEMVAAICGEKAITKGDLDRRPVGCGGGSCGGQRQRSGELHSFECAFL